MSRRRRSTQRGARREPVDTHTPIKGQLALFGDDVEPAEAEQPVADGPPEEVEEQ